MSVDSCHDAQHADVDKDDIPGRLDRVPWCRFHVIVIAALGVAWILDGLEFTLVGSLAALLERRATLHLSAQDIGVAASAYLVGAVVGSLTFGYLADRYGRKRLFTTTLLLYTGATAATGLSWGLASFALFRFLTGAGIGGEYSAINSAIQELIPARRRGRIDLLVNGSFWIGSAAASTLSLVILHSGVIAPALAWRVAFTLGAILGLLALRLRRLIPESPRWLASRGRAREADAIVTAIERHAGVEPPGPSQRTGAVKRAYPVRFFTAPRVIFGRYRKRAILAATLMVAQLFFYNAFFFTYALVLVRFYHTRATDVGAYLLPFALSNFLGAAILGRFFDTVGRRPMITGTYALSGILMIVAAWLFRGALLGGTAQTGAWAAAFFFASAGASAAYLTVSESFPLEIRASAIALFFAFGTAVGGVVAPSLLGVLIASGSRHRVFWGYMLGAILMLFGALAEWRYGLATEGRSLESIAASLTDEPATGTGRNSGRRDTG